MAHHGSEFMFLRLNPGAVLRIHGVLKTPGLVALDLPV